ncbi:hypothetical protein ABVK25_002525 [Lepraria finkii]|uniref:Uncharacterized protein n=1 Tax=Lepraria finkii TaxID=1340010 RepID=A0ABR4BI22_9LECA
MHQFHNLRGCTAQDVTNILDRIPKKIRGKLEHRFGAVGYGMHAVPEWAFWKVLVALAVLQLGPLVVAVRWLCGHPGDLQNGFNLSMYLVGLMNVLVVMPDIWSTYKSHRS